MSHHNARQRGAALRKERSRQRFLDAATELLAHKGYHPTTTRDICRRMGASTGALYTHFRSKEELYREVIRRQEDHFVRHLRRVCLHHRHHPQEVTLAMVALVLGHGKLMRLLAHDDGGMGGTVTDGFIARLMARLHRLAPAIDATGVAQMVRHAAGAYGVAMLWRPLSAFATTQMLFQRLASSGWARPPALAPSG